ncbi:helix-turn-helix domain-containing protein [Brachybacterium paraconglomeratum]|uniref:helix-turn-helix domain-containing protein n=1 Tax=Brachybacterium paraconglomeratum TaxID=173362 RepID=UPI00387A1D95
MPPRFVPLSDVAETLSISASQAYALVRSGELRAIKVGGRGQWRVEVTELESYIERSYRRTEALLEEERALERGASEGRH